MAHTLALHFNHPVYTFQSPDTLPDSYQLFFLPSIKIFRTSFALPSKALFALLKERSLHIHLPSTSALFVALLYLCIGLVRKNCLTFHWHAFVFSSITNHISFKYLLGRIYEFFALIIVRLSSAVVTTSPSLLQTLRSVGISSSSSFYLSPSISGSAEDYLLSHSSPSLVASRPFKLFLSVVLHPTKTITIRAAQIDSVNGHLISLVMVPSLLLQSLLRTSCYFSC